MDIADQIKKLEDLRSHGALSDEEFAKAKAKLLGSQTGPEIPDRTWIMLLHLSQLLGFVVPLCGFIVPFLIWQFKKSDIPDMDKHGKEVANWIISSLIYAMVSAVLIFVLIGYPMLLAVIALDIAFPIYAALKAKEGVFWKYPFTIRFI